MSEMSDTRVGRDKVRVLVIFSEILERSENRTWAGLFLFLFFFGKEWGCGHEEVVFSGQSERKSNIE